ncbi:MAG: deoxyribodipyrimidine photo-lyase [Bacteroidales bacterium]
MNPSVNIFWFRRDLRYSDNRGLYAALKAGQPVIPLFIFDREILDELDDPFDKRIDFIYQQLCSLHKIFQHYNSTLLIKQGIPEEVFRTLLQTYNIGKVFANHDYEPYATERDHKIKAMLSRQNIAFKTYKDQVIFEKDDIVKQDGSPYSVFTPYSRAWRAKFTDDHTQVFESENHLHQLANLWQPLPSLKEIGFNPTETKFPDIQPPMDIIKDYHKYRDYPALDKTSRLGVHLRFGTLSVRYLAALGFKLNPVWLNELIWREFFMMILYHHPHVVYQEFKAKYRHIPWRDSESDYIRWRSGTTGYPMVDAGMRELSQTGYMHNRVRMITAGFLCKHLLLDWRLGEAWFAQNLLDYELSSNNGNWQWAAGTGCDAAPYFRIFNPETQQQRFDPDSVYISKWIQEYNTPAYPEKIISHKAARERALKTYKKALHTAKGY